MITRTLKFTAMHLFCGGGGFALGTEKATARFAGCDATFENVGGVDIDEDACKDFEMLTGVPALCADMHTLTPVQLLRYCPTSPDAVFASPPCKGFSALLGAKRAAEPVYQKMNMLLVDALFLVCSTWKRMPRVIFFENVPRIQSRGAHVIDTAYQTLRAHGYTISDGTHDCGEIGNLAQHRRRWFMIARHRDAVPRFIYHVRKRPVRACGEVIGPLPMPGDVSAAGDMHAVPNLSWKNWVRLSLIPAGGDWRDIPGVLKPGQKRRELFRRAPLQAWDEPTATVAGPGGSNIGAVSDPRVGEWYNGALGVTGFDQPAGVVTGNGRPATGRFSVADPRPLWGNAQAFDNVMSVRGAAQPAKTVIGASRVGSGAQSVADPDWYDKLLSLVGRHNLPDTKETAWQQVAGVTPWDKPGPTVSSSATIHAGAFQVQDPRVDIAIKCAPRAGAYRVLSWEQAAQTITGSMSIDNGAAAVADPRLHDKPPAFTPVIISDDGCWHRPFTTYELARLQSFPTHMRDGKPLRLSGNSHTRWRLVIGNAVPPDSAESIGENVLMALLAAKAGVPSLVTGPVWAQEAEALITV